MRKLRVGFKLFLLQSIAKQPSTPTLLGGRNEREELRIQSHSVVIGPTAAFRWDPGDDLVGIHNVAGFAVDTIGEIDGDLLRAGHVGGLDHLVNFSRTEVLAGIAVLNRTTCVADIRVMYHEVYRLIVIVLGAGVIDVSKFVESELAIAFDGTENVLASVATGWKDVNLLQTLMAGM